MDWSAELPSDAHLDALLRLLAAAEEWLTARTSPVSATCIALRPNWPLGGDEPWEPEALLRQVRGMRTFFEGAPIGPASQKRRSSLSTAKAGLGGP